MTQVYCTDKNPEAEGNMKPCKHRANGRCTRKHLRIRLYWDDDAYHLNQVCEDQEE